MKHHLYWVLTLILLGACSSGDEAPLHSIHPKGTGNEASSPASAPTLENAKRIALIIGNADYQHIPSLDNPVNDANDMTAVLQKLGFEVLLGRNAGQRELKNAVHTFGQRLEDGGVGLFYFSGHGLQVDQSNFLVPVDANIRTEAEIEFESVNAGRVLAQMEQRNPNGLNIVILDACRDNPFASTAMKGLRKGLAEMNSPKGTLIAYATSPNLASYGDSDQRNSIYTKYLLNGLRDKPHLSVLDMLTSVASQVVTETNGLQVPWKADSLVHRFCFADCGSGLPPPPARPDMSRLLRACQTHFEANRLTSGRGGTALACYEEVLATDSANATALQGLANIEARYVEWAKAALQQGKTNKAKRYLASLRQMNPNSSQLAALEARLVSDNNPFVAGQAFRDRLTDGSEGPEMVWIPAGRFRMGDIQGGGDGDEQPVHSVSVDRFALGKYELTVGEYLRFVRATGRHAPQWLEEGSKYHIKTGTSDYYKKYGSALTNENHPIVGISWHDATAYVKWLSEQTGHQYRLPTEAQWEYAARAGTTTKYWWGNDIGTNRANCGSDCGDNFKYTALVGSFAKNPYGLYDTVGNVWEWTCSEYQDKYAGKEQQCVDSAGYFVLRGGAWSGDATWARSATRNSSDPTNRISIYGFRPARIK